MTFRKTTLPRRWAWAALAAFASALPARGAASSIQCGDTLSAGAWLLETDLVCPSNSGSGVGITLQSGAALDLGGHSVAMSIAGSGVSIELTGTGASLAHGTAKNAERAILLSGGGGHHLSDLRATGSNIGIYLDHSDGNAIATTDVSGNAVFGVSSDTSNGNHYDQLVADDTNGIGPAAGILLFASNDNTLTRSEVLRSQCTGIRLVDASRNTIAFNSVQDSFISIFKDKPSVDILVMGASTHNLILKNEVSATATPPVTSDGINIGCKDGCNCGLGGPGISEPTTGATHNVVVGNTADGELRYGIAQATGNPKNVYAADEASGNGTANFAIDP
ncbi:NosD domain-containing protein [Anaeromyxobacter diazotrophicus]|uniref:Periplasmic copper-binding protein NosD beta helix domain-containing protein n=1 Tax=Anaeromyxobacter diazotrophicus TaxID=2590199 RepID=A0A7I9VQ29_9BACT|nr:NosD domain-containing protein [Anaeromyxobacter diazotrophicus]GEJ58461.1 hypothetical protein AMYX_32020 [Anaeromyxobacter diazotrophicus]